MPPREIIEARTRPVRIGEARCAAVAEIAGEVIAGKPRPLWRLNAGGVMLTRIDGINGGEFIQLVIDLETVTFAKSVEMLREHDDYRLIGRWEELSSSLTGPIGPGVYGRPMIYTPENESENDIWAFREAAEVDAFLRRGHPFQASVSTIGGPNDHAIVPPGQTVTVNGVALTALAGDPPLYVGHNLTVFEASICRHGADTNTGPTARNSRQPQPTPNPEPRPMEKILLAMLAAHPERHHGVIARLARDGKTESEITARLMADDKKAADDATAALTADLAASTAKLAEKDTEIAALKAALADLKPGEEIAAKIPAGDGDAKAQLAAPKTITDGIARLKSEGSKLVSFQLRKAALTRWPDLRKLLPSMSGRPAA